MLALQASTDLRVEVAAVVAVAGVGYQPARIRAGCSPAEEVVLLLGQQLEARSGVHVFIDRLVVVRDRGLRGRSRRTRQSHSTAVMTVRRVWRFVKGCTPRQTRWGLHAWMLGTSAGGASAQHKGSKSRGRAAWRRSHHWPAPHPRCPPHLGLRAYEEVVVDARVPHVVDGCRYDHCQLLQVAQVRGKVVGCQHGAQRLRGSAVTKRGIAQLSHRAAHCSEAASRPEAAAATTASFAADAAANPAIALAA